MIEVLFGIGLERMIEFVIELLDYWRPGWYRKFLLSGLVGTPMN
jgi:hypothetical protein